MGPKTKNPGNPWVCAFSAPDRAALTAITKRAELVALIALLATSCDVRATLRQEAKLAREQIAAEPNLAVDQAGQAFVLAAEHIVMAEADCQRALKRARILQAFFPDRLGPRFAEPVALSIGRDRFDLDERLAIPLPDPSGCTKRKTIKLTPATVKLLKKFRSEPFSPFKPTTTPLWEVAKPPCLRRAQGE
jgi:hypothetical protein